MRGPYLQSPLSEILKVIDKTLKPGILDQWGTRLRMDKSKAPLFANLICRVVTIPGTPQRSRRGGQAAAFAGFCWSPAAAVYRCRFWCSTVRRASETAEAITRADQTVMRCRLAAGRFRIERSVDVARCPVGEFLHWRIWGKLPGSRSVRLARPRLQHSLEKLESIRRHSPLLG